MLERSRLNRNTDGSPGRPLSDQSVLFPKVAFLKTGIPGIRTGPEDGLEMWQVYGHGDEERKKRKRMSLDCAVLLLSEQTED